MQHVFYGIRMGLRARRRQAKPFKPRQFECILIEWCVYSRDVLEQVRIKVQISLYRTALLQRAVSSTIKVNLEHNENLRHV